MIAWVTSAYKMSYSSFGKLKLLSQEVGNCYVEIEFIRQISSRVWRNVSLCVGVRVKFLSSFSSPCFLDLRSYFLFFFLLTKHIRLNDFLFEWLNLFFPLLLLKRYNVKKLKSYQIYLLKLIKIHRNSSKIFVTRIINLFGIDYIKNTFILILGKVFVKKGKWK